MYADETKTLDFEFHGNSGITFLPMHLYEHLNSFNSEMAKIDELLFDGGVETVDHTDHSSAIDRGISMLAYLLQYTDGAANQASYALDTPLKNNFKNNACKTIGDIDIDSFTTENTLGLRQVNGVQYGSMDARERAYLTLSDFLGINNNIGKDDLAVPQEFADFRNQYVEMYNNMKANLVDKDGKQISLTDFLYGLADLETPSHQMASMVSNLLDVIFIKPLIESIYGKDLITGDELSDTERGMKAVCGLIGIITLGTSGVLDMPFEEAMASLGKLILVDAASNQASYMVSLACQEMDVPLPLMIILSFAAGATVSYNLNGLIFEDALANKVRYQKDDLFDAKWKSDLDPELYAKYQRYYDDPLFVNQVTGEYTFGISPQEVDTIVTTPKGMRPSPDSYLSGKYIENHLAQFDDGASIIMTKEQYIQYVKGKEYIGIPSDGTQFVLPKGYCDEIAELAQGDISVYETQLGFDPGHFEDGGGLVRIDIEDLDGLNLRVPSGNEAGANSHWVPGGRTDGGTPEAITDLIPNDSNNVTITELN
jgi:hypothetical protein